MPFHYEERVSPKGRTYVRVEIFGEIGLDDAREFSDHFGKSGRYYLKHTLSVIARGTEFTAEARKHLIEIRDVWPNASVVTSPLVRAAVNLMVRFKGTSDRFRMFSDEATALAWLDDQEV